MTVQSTTRTFIPWNPHLREGEDLDCSICKEPLSETPETPAQIPIKHTGSNGEKHPATHLGCLTPWLEKNQLCMACKEPLDKEQLSLFLDELKTLKISSLSWEDLTSIALESIEDLTTPEGISKKSLKHLNRAIRNLEAAFLTLEPLSTRYIELLEERTHPIQENLEASTEEDYFLTKQLLANMPKAILSEYQENYNSAISDLTDKITAYRECARIYVLNAGVSHITIVLHALSQSRDSLLEYAKPPLSTKARELKILENNYTQTTSKIQKLERKVSTFFNPLGFKLEILFMSILLLSSYPTLREYYLASELYDKEDPEFEEYRCLWLCLGFSFIITFILHSSLENDQNYAETKDQINDLLICKIKFPLKNAYQTLTAFSELIKEA